MKPRVLAIGSLVLLLGVAHLRGADSARRSGVAEVVEADVPLLRSWKAAVFPAGLPKDVQSGKATLRTLVDSEGRVTSARVLEESDPAFGAAAMAVIKEWTFAPRMENGKPQPTCIDVPFTISRQARQADPKAMPPGPQPSYAPRTKAMVESAPISDYPPALAGRGFSGEVHYACLVNADGTASGFQIIGASDAEFVVPALESSRRWRFKPAMEGDLVLVSPIRGKVTFDEVSPGSRESVLEANGITLAPGTEANAAPRVVCAMDPVYPYELLLKGEGGVVVAEFTVTANGKVRDVQVREATHPDFAAALVSAMETWWFEAAIHEGRRVDARLVKRAEFKPFDGSAAAEGHPVARLVQAVKDTTIEGGRGLDARLEPVFRVAPVVPSGVEKPGKVEVKVEFIIDQQGRARLPRLVAAPQPELGWAALTAVSQWVFRAPTRGGKPTDVRVQIPLSF